MTQVERIHLLNQIYYNRWSFETLIKMSLIVGDGCLKRITDLFAHLISTHSLMSFPLRTTTGRFL